MNTVQTTVTAIHKMNSDELNQIVEAIKLRRTYLARQKAASFQVGDPVEFNARGRIVRGVITKINQKTMQVREDRGGFATTNWKVTASLVRAVETV